MHNIVSLFFLGIIKCFRNPLSVIPVFFFPVFELFLFGSLDRSFNSGSVYANAFLVGALLWVIIYRSQQEISNGLLEDVNSKNLKNILSTPVTLSQYITSLILVSFAKLFITFAIYIISSYVLFSFYFLDLPKYVAVVFINFMFFGITLGVISAGLILRYGTRIQFLSWMISMILYPFMSIYYSSDVLSPPFNMFARMLPTSYLSDYLRGTESFGLNSIAIGTIINLIYAALSWLLLFFLFNKALKKGVLYFQ